MPHFSPRPNRAHEIRWREWSPEAFAEARGDDKPILLSISAVWCHWCHVMDETAYSDQGVIDLVNSEYVPVRVDNDDRPDINARYNMGGWPTTAFLTPQGDILTGATYLPADQMNAALRQVLTAYRTQKPQIVARILEHKKHLGAQARAGAGDVSAAQVDDMLEWLGRAYDGEYGGFGGAPKFPMTDALAFLAEQSVLRGDSSCLQMARQTLEAMAGGGTYDHVEGGFFRYSTTQDWSVPHFEKMLEDHGGLLYALALCGDGDVLDDAARYLETVLREDGCYAGSQDADEEYYARDAAGRQALEPPFVDRRVYTSWNCGLAVAYLEADRRLDRPHLKESAERCLDALFAERLREDGTLNRLPGEGGLLGDQVFGLWAAVRSARLDVAQRLAAGLERFAAEGGGYLDRIGESEPLGRLEEPVLPLAENSIAAIALLELDALAGDPEAPWRARAGAALRSVSGAVRQHGILAAIYARAADRLLRPAVKVTTSNRELARAALEANPYCVIEPGDDRAIVCVGTVCLAPTAEKSDVQKAVLGTTLPA